ncbi:MAG: hypothetical protein KGI78_04155 [Patescibacteria group bacterium]|nr:hypothetical protein [Patescibacteria group bacterium]MDE1945526.1 hypothetical protein [Patescibacteria group bacterium]MDE2058008.1 hypothetical protein [Patescibacteria group bacterium]
MSGAQIEAAGVLATKRRRWYARACGFCGRHGWHLARHMPFFIYVLAVFIGVKLLVPNVRAPVFVGIRYSATYVECLYVLGAIAGMAELLRVSKPGVDQTNEALAMIFTSVGYFALFLLSLTGYPLLQIFRDTEFLVLLAMSAGQSVLAVKINARTLKRTIDTGVHDS